MFKVVTIILALGNPSQESLDEGARSTPPNVIVMMADDLGYGDLASYGNDILKTPVLDKMASEGPWYASTWIKAVLSIRPMTPRI